MIEEEMIKRWHRENKEKNDTESRDRERDDKDNRGKRW